MALLTLLSAFFTIFFLAVFVYRALISEKRVVAVRLENYVERRRQPVVPLQATQEAASRQVSSWRAFIRYLSKYFDSLQSSRLMEHKLIQAGLPLRGSEFMVICLGTALLGFITIFLFSGASLLPALAGAGAGYFVPVVFLKIKIDKRVKAFNDQLGDCLILVANSLRTGYSFMQALEMVSREMPQPIADEFGRVLKEMGLGVSTEQAMNNLAKRVNSDDLDLVITAVLIQRQVGGNLAEVLDNIAGTIRERVKIKGQIKTLTAQGRISGIIISLLPVGIGSVIYFINPEYIGLLFIHPVGKAMLVAGVVSQLMGILLIRRIVNIEV